MTNKFIKVGNNLLVLDRGYCCECVSDKVCRRGEVKIQMCEDVSNKFGIELYNKVGHIIITRSISISLFLTSFIKNRSISEVNEINNKTLINLYEL